MNTITRSPREYVATLWPHNYVSIGRKLLRGFSAEPPEAVWEKTQSVLSKDPNSDAVEVIPFTPRDTLPEEALKAIRTAKDRFGRLKYSSMPSGLGVAKLEKMEAWAKGEGIDLRGQGHYARNWKIQQLLPVFTKAERAKRRATAARRGSNGISKYGQRMLRSAVCLMTDHYGMPNLSMMTLTMPSFSDEGMEKIHKNFSKLWNAFTHWCIRRCQRLEIPYHAATCFEIQEGRYDKYGIPVLHSHSIHPTFAPDGTEIYPEHLVRKEWTGLLELYAEEKANYKAVVEVAPIHKSPEHYIAKYVSKGVKVIKRMVADGYEGFIPHTWWAMTAAMRNWIEECKLCAYDLTGQYLDEIKDMLNDAVMYPFLSWVGSKWGEPTKYRGPMLYGACMYLEGPENRADFLLHLDHVGIEMERPYRCYGKDIPATA